MRVERVIRHNLSGELREPDIVIPRLANEIDFILLRLNLLIHGHDGLAEL